MSTIKVNILGNFITTVDNERIIFPYGKVEALFYYLIVNKYSSRDHLANLLWPDMEDKTAKKNLRNALYTLKKLFVDIDLFSFNGLSSVSLNPDIHIDSDYVVFIENENNIEVFKGEFLLGYTVKDTDEFERWLFKVRDECNFIYSSRLWNKISENKERKNYLQLENICQKIIELDEYDESGYIELMNCYKEQLKYSNAIEVYNELSDLLLKELEVAPNNEVQRVYTEILDLMNEREKINTSQKFFFGRDKEIRLLKNNYDFFKQNDHYHSFLIRGEMGVGKTRLKEYFVNEISDEVVNVVEANCYKFEENYVLRPWKSILVNMLKIIRAEKITLSQTLLDILVNIAPEFEIYKKEITKRINFANDSPNLFEIEDVVLEVIKIVSNKKKIILIFEDIHWMDASSLRLLNSLLVSDELKHCIFFLTMRNEMNSELEKFLIYINNYTNVEKVELTPFNQDEVKRFIDRALPKEKVTSKMVKEIYNETEGNAFFLTEYIQAINNNQTDNIMSSRIKDVLKSRFIDLNNNERRIVELISLFYDEVSITILGKFTNLDDLEIIEIADSLVEKGLLKENTYHHDICYTFVHQKLREFQYLQISNGKKKILHNRIGKLLELNLQHHLSDIDIYYKLIYHFEKAGNDIDTLKYRIKSLNKFYNFIHERFPVIHFDKESFSKLYIGEEETEHNLEKLVRLFKRVKSEHASDEELITFEMNVLHLNGRYKIRKGNYESGLKDIESLIKLAVEQDCIDFILKGYEQKICYSIQTCNTVVMGQVLSSAQPFLNKSTVKGDEGVWIRYRGMYDYLKGNDNEAEELFRESISIHTHDLATFEKYRLNIAACYNNIGNIRRKQGRFEESLHYYEKAISICNEKNLWISISLFKTNAGVACYHAKNFSKSKEYLQSALAIYNKLEYNLSQPLAETYMCLLLLMEKDYQSALNYLLAADKHVQVLKNPIELICLLELKKAVTNEMEKNKALYNVFHKYLRDLDCTDIEENKRKLLEKFPLSKLRIG